jgi:hypothetical protein
MHWKVKGNERSETLRETGFGLLEIPVEDALQGVLVGARIGGFVMLKCF